MSFIDGCNENVLTEKGLFKTKKERINFSYLYHQLMYCRKSWIKSSDSVCETEKKTKNCKGQGCFSNNFKANILIIICAYMLVRGSY